MTLIGICDAFSILAQMDTPAVNLTMTMQFTLSVLE